MAESADSQQQSTLLVRQGRSDTSLVRLRLVAPFLDELDHRGVDGAQLLRRHGLSLEMIRHTNMTLGEFYQEMVDITAK